MQKLILVAGLASLFLTGRAHAETSGEVGGWCQQYDSVSPTPGSGFIAPSDPHSLFCWGAFTSVQELISEVDSGSRRPLLSVCAPPQSTRTQLIHVFRRYIVEHPEIEHWNFGTGVVVALRAAFPCK